ncbi:NAD(P)H-dependent oxidoreductase [Paraburkholderia fungorum]
MNNESAAAARSVRALVVYTHPEPTSFSAAMKDTAVDALKRAGVIVEVSDLYAENFNPVGGRHDFQTVADPTRFHYQTEQLEAARMSGFAEDIVREQARVARADLLVFVFPLWWGGVPAMLKGWFDRVLAYGFAYADGRRYEHGYFMQKRGILGVSTGGTQHRFSEGGSYGDISTVLHGVKHCMLEYLGLEAADPFVAYAAPRVSEKERVHYLQKWRARVTGTITDRNWLDRLAKSDVAPREAAATPEVAGGWANMK